MIEIDNEELPILDGSAKIFIEKITLNVGAGKDESKLNKGIKLISKLTKKKVVALGGISKKNINKKKH